MKTAAFALFLCGLIVTGAAAGQRAEVEGYQGYNGDDSSLNAIALYFTGQSDSNYISSTKECWGTWRGKRPCFNGRYLNGFRLSVEPYQGPGEGKGDDDRTANDMQMRCLGNGQTLYGGGLDFGKWSS